MSEEQKEINNQYDELRTVINDAARVKAEINSTCKESLKNMKRDFSEFMYDNVADEFKDVAERLGLFNGFADVEDKKKREKKIEGALKSFFGKMFNCLCLTNAKRFTCINKLANSFFFCLFCF